MQIPKLISIFRQLTIAALASVICACGPSESLTKMSAEARAGGPVLLSCADGWAKCYSDADRICGARGYTELDRHQNERITSTGRLDKSRYDDGELRADTRFDVQNQTLTIRCKT